MRYSAIVLGAVAFATLSGAALAQDAKQDFRLVNKTGYEIKEVYVSPSKSSDWEEDILGDGVLSDADAREIHFHRSAKSCHWDLKVVYTVELFERGVGRHRLVLGRKDHDPLRQGRRQDDRHLRLRRKRFARSGYGRCALYSLARTMRADSAVGAAAKRAR